MRVVTNERRIKSKRRIAQYLFVISLVILIGGLIVSNFGPKTMEFAIIAPCLVLPIGFATTLLSVRMTNQFVRLPHPDEAIGEGLKGINRRSILYNYILQPNHVLVAPQGVFSLTTRWQETGFEVDGEKWYNAKGRGPLAPIFLFLKQERLGDPFKQARQEAESIQAIVDEALPSAKIVVRPAVVFTSNKAKLEVDEPALPVVYADPKKRPSLKALLKDEKKKDEISLDDEQIAALDKAFRGNQRDLVENETA
ncbi:MAG TPA: hypothetical protein VKQ72_23250 [Aggregatilineales bacterium]|nr:hypothetical protein [Aggregatilineales bacterium]